jgi:type II secretory ATPase GspE/PulE/Tfp pilus assembly ATPase PilB-like protein
MVVSLESLGETMSFTGNEIGKLLIELELITPEELATAQEEQLRSGERVTLILEKLGYVSFNQLKDTLELQFGVNFISLAKSPPEKATADLISLEVKRQYQLIPIQCHQAQVTVAMVNPDDLLALDYLRVTLKTGHIKKLVCTQDDFEYCLDRLYGKTVQETAVQEPSSLPEAAVKSPVLETTLNSQTAATKETNTPAVSTPETVATPVPSAYSPGKLPGKQHLKSLFGDDDDDDDLESLVRKPSSSPAQTTPSPTPSPTQSLAPVTSAAQSSASPVDSTQIPTPALTSTSTTATPQVETTAVQNATPVAEEAAPEAPAFDLTVVEDVMETVLASVTSQLTELPIEDSQRQLLEEVIESELADIEEMDLNHIQEAQSASVMLLAHEIIGKASQKKCSDIHLEPDTTGISLRYFLHGELLAACVLPLEIHQSLVSSYKIIAGLNPSEKDKPQDKKLKTRVDDEHIELRITTMPSDNGEMVAISIKFSDAQ